MTEPEPKIDPPLPWWADGPEYRVGVDPPCGGRFDRVTGHCDRCAAINPDRAGLLHTWP